jgi:hypothetical protein
VRKNGKGESGAHGFALDLYLKARKSFQKEIPYEELFCFCLLVYFAYLCGDLSRARTGPCFGAG